MKGKGGQHWAEAAKQRTQEGAGPIATSQEALMGVSHADPNVVTRLGDGNF